MLSRVADSLYWMSRYLERAENTVRQLDVAMSLMLDSGGASAESHWQRLLASLGKPAGFEWNGDVAANAQKLVFDKHHPASVACCIDAARENARQIREEISTEQWQRLNRLYHQMHASHIETQFRSSINDVLGSIIDAIHLFKGVSDTTMIHGQGWHFIRLGRYLERAYAIATLLQVYQPHLFHAPEREISGIGVNKDAHVELDALPGKSLQGKVVRVAPALDPTTRTLDAEVQLKNDSGELRPGMYGIGAIVYELLTGDRLWEQPWPAADPELLFTNAYVDPPPNLRNG